MFLLPKSFGPLTLKRKLGAGGVAASYAGELNDPVKGDVQVVIRRILPYLLKDRARLPSVEARVRDLMGVRHPYLVQVMDWIAVEDERFIVEQRVDGVDLERVVHWCKQNNRSLPPNIFLHLATQICTGVEALHGRPGKGTGAQNILHLGLTPGHLFVTREGKVLVGGYALTRSPTSLPHGGVNGPVAAPMEYLSPEQTHPDQKLTPASDVFALGSVLYELLTNRSLFKAESNLNTIHRVRRAEVSSQLLEVKQQIAGLDKVLYRALSLNPRHRYQRAFVLREDLRGLMAGYTFASIASEVQSFLAPLFQHLDANAPIPDAHGYDDNKATQVAKDPIGDASRISKQVKISQSTRKRAPAPVPAPPPSQAVARPAPTAEAAARPIAPPVPPPPSSVMDAAPAPPPRAAIPVPQLGTPKAAPPPRLAAPPPPPPSSIGGEQTRIRVQPQTDSLENDDSTRIRVQGSGGDGIHGESTQIRIEPGPTAGEPAPPPPVLPTANAPEADEPINTSLAAATAAVIGGGAAAAAAAAAAFGDKPHSNDQALAAPSPITAPMPAPPKRQEPELELDDPPPPQERLASPVPLPRPVAPSPKPIAPPMAPPQVTAPQVTAPQAPAPTASDRLAAAAPPPSRPAQPHAAPQVQSAAAQAPVGGPPPQQKSGTSWLPIAVGAVAFFGIVCVGGWFITQDDGVEVAAQAELTEDAPPIAEPIEEPVEEPAEPLVADVEPEEEEPEVVKEEPRERPQDNARAANTYTPPANTYTPPANTYTPPANTYTPPAETYTPPADTRSRTRDEDAVADVEIDDTPSDATAVEQYHGSARAGRLTPSDVMNLEMVDTSDPSYTRSRALLLMNAEQAGDTRSTSRYLDQLMVLPENQYNPVFLSKRAQYDANRGSYRTALDTSVLAERYWARIPPELIFETKAEIYETQAGALQGLFYANQDSLDLLDQAIAGWEKYQRHVEKQGRTDLSSRAEKKLATLRDVQARLQ